MKVAEPEIHLIPYSYRGQITITFGINTGSVAEYDEAGRRIYKIGQDGILNTRFSPNMGIRPPENFQYYLVENDKQTILPNAADKDNEPITLVVSDVYVTQEKLYYFIDALENIKKYKNPTIDENERKIK